MRCGHWVILDELNLAPSDVLEALNRVLDDNRELFIPETQKVVKAHPNFMLFATQNPPGLYGGRKVGINHVVFLFFIYLLVFRLCTCRLTVSFNRFYLELLGIVSLNSTLMKFLLRSWRP